MSSECHALPASRIASAAGALAITSVLLLAVGLGFPARASAEASVARPVGAVTAPAQADAGSIARGRFVWSLGAKGERMPTAVGPNANVKTPYIEFTPKNLPAMTQVAPVARQGGRG